MKYVTQSSMRAWTAIPGATSYVITAQTGVGHPLGDGINILPEVDVGNVLTLPTSTWLSGQELNQPYELFVKAINANEVGPWGQLNVTLFGELKAPVITYRPRATRVDWSVTRVRSGIYV